jgi:hypothetical protein
MRLYALTELHDPEAIELSSPRRTRNARLMIVCGMSPTGAGCRASRRSSPQPRRTAPTEQPSFLRPGSLPGCCPHTIRCVGGPTAAPSAHSSVEPVSGDRSGLAQLENVLGVGAPTRAAAGAPLPSNRHPSLWPRARHLRLAPRSDAPTGRAGHDRIPGPSAPFHDEPHSPMTLSGNSGL